MYHIFRYDDYSSVSCALVEERLFESLAHNGMKCSVGVIPAVAVPRWEPGESIPLEPLAPERWRRLRYWVEQGVVDAALHGYSHLAVSPVRGIAEFGERVAPEQQHAPLRAGKQAMEDGLGCSPRVFIPPWNGYSKATLEALQEVGIPVVAAGFNCTLTHDELLFLPATLGAEGTLTALQRARGLEKEGPIVVTNLHDYDFVEAGFGGRWSWSLWEEQLAQLKALTRVEHSTVADLALQRPKELVPADCLPTRPCASGPRRDGSSVAAQRRRHLLVGTACFEVVGG